jgi:predicted Rossmann fold nucleotide-binding protein DprA/Smf involved in DNA uptake
MDERMRAWLVLTLLPDLGRARINTLIRHFGSPEAVLDASEQALTDAGIGALAVRSILDWRRLADVDNELRLIEKTQRRDHHDSRCRLPGQPGAHGRAAAPPLLSRNPVPHG